MSISPYIRLVNRDFYTPDSLLAFLKDAHGALDQRGLPVINPNQGEPVLFDALVDKIDRFAKNRWQLSEASLKALLGAIEKLRVCLGEGEQPAIFWSRICCCRPIVRRTGLDRREQLDERERFLQSTLDLHLYAKAKLAENQQNVYFFPKQSGQVRAFHINRANQIIVHENRKKEGDRLLGCGAEKVVSCAYQLGTTNIFASAGFKYIGKPNEIEYLHQFKGVPGFVQIVDEVSYLKDGEPKWRVTLQYCNAKTLREVIFEKEIPFEKRKMIFILLIKAVAVMHEMGYLHRDLNPTNIFLHEENGLLFPKIGDFGAMCKINDVVAREDHCTTCICASPEYAVAQTTDDEKMKKGKIVEATTTALDSWSLGCLLFHLCKMGRLPWFGLNENRALFQDPIQRYKEWEAKIFKMLKGVKGDWLAEPAKINSPEHLVWKMLQQRLSAQGAKAILPQLEWDSENQ